MRDGILRVAAGTPDIALCDPAQNAQAVIRLMKEAAARQVKLLVLPELCLTGASSGDLFWQKALLDAAWDALMEVARASAGLGMLTVVGLPVWYDSASLNCAACVYNGELLGITAKSNLSTAERRWFRPLHDEEYTYIDKGGSGYSLSDHGFYRCENMRQFEVSVAHLSDAMDGPSSLIVACPAAVPEIAGAPERVRTQLAAASERFHAAYILASAGSGESTTDMVYAGRRMIYEHGALVVESGAFETGLTVTEIDLAFLNARRCADDQSAPWPEWDCQFEMDLSDTPLSRPISPSPFTPDDPAARAARCEQILAIQVEGLVQRMQKIRCQTALLGVSGGLDSTLAMIVAARALLKLGLPQENLHAITMPCFGTTDRTKNNAYKLAECLGSSLREINITASVVQHFQDIGHDLDTHDAAFENAQARERTQVLMDLANMENGLVVGTGDLSELALGWATYNGDHMSMYGVNGGVPKTLIRHITRHVADTAKDEALRACLLDILDTPVSPELLPPKEGQIAQKTEELVGPYALHDFFLYHFMRRMATPRKLKRLAMKAFEGVYDEAAIDKWLQTFLRRFFSQQFKRSCMPDGPMVGPVTLSPRGGLVMPSDASARTWQDHLQ